jgi:hypothetical protein
MADEPQAPEERPKRRAHLKMTEADKALLKSVLLRPDARVDGKIHVPTIARLTGLTDTQVRSFMKHDTYWRAQQAEVNPDTVVPSESELINAPAQPPGIIMSPDDFAKAQAILRQQRKMVTKDWEGLGMDEAMAKRMERLSRMGGAPLLPVIQMLYGGLLKHVATLDEVLENDAANIKANQLPAEVDKEGAPVEDGKVQREWRYVWYAGYKLHLELFNSMQKTQAMLAKIARDMKDLQNANKSPEKGVFVDATVVSERKPDAA